MKKNTEQKVYLIHGSPLSGKTTYVNKVSKPGDLIVDVDNIWQSISGCGRYDKPRELSGTVLKIYNMLVEMVKNRQGEWNNAYVICTEFSKKFAEKMCNELNAEFIFLDTDKETCMKRLEECGDGRSMDTWRNYINIFFNINKGGLFNE